MKTLPDWLDRPTQVLLALGTSILAVNLVIGWATDALDLALRLPAVVNTLTVLVSVAFGTAGIAGTLYQRRQNRHLARERDEWEELANEVIEGYKELRGIPSEPPAFANCTTVKVPAFDSSEISRLYHSAIPEALSAYSDARLYSFSMIFSENRRPSIEIEFGFYSEHAGRCVTCSWDNYGGRIETTAGHKPPSEFRRVFSPPLPWDQAQGWERQYTLAYEKAQPFYGEVTAYVSADSSLYRGHIITFQFRDDTPGGRILPFAIDQSGALVEKGNLLSIHAARIAFVDTVRPRPYLRSTNSKRPSP